MASLGCPGFSGRLHEKDLPASGVPPDIYVNGVQMTAEAFLARFEQRNSTQALRSGKRGIIIS